MYSCSPHYVVEQTKAPSVPFPHLTHFSRSCDQLDRLPTLLLDLLVPCVDESDLHIFIIDMRFSS